MSLQEHTHLQEKGASEIELADLWTKVIYHQEQERVATIEFHKAEQKMMYTISTTKEPSKYFLWHL